jgi:DHA2 family multidrug resistance protein
MGFFFAPATQLALKKLGDKTTLGVSLMHYIRFVGGSFGTALATNDLQRFAWENFQRTNELQDYNLLSLKLEEAVLWLSDYTHQAQEKALGMLYNFQYLYAFSDAFGSTLFLAGLWALVGALAVVYMLFADLLERKYKNLRKDATTTDFI